MNIAHEIFRNNPDSIAFAEVEAERSPLTYGEVAKLVAAIAKELDLHRFSPTERVALTTPRGKEGLIAFLAVSSHAICCPLDPRLIEDELSAALRDLAVNAVIDATGDRRIANIAQSLAIPLLPLRFAELPRDRSTALPAVTGENDVALLLQTSGTTSKPKHVALTHSNILAAAKTIALSYSIGEQDLCINPMPHHHVHGLISAGLSSLVSGASQFCATSFAPAAFDSAFERLAPTWFTGSPAFHLGLLDFYTTTGRWSQHKSLRFIRSSSAPFPASAIARYEALFGVPLLENYGMTETASTICSNLLSLLRRKQGSVGWPIGSEIRIVDSAGEAIAAGIEGEILLRGPSVITKYASGECGPDHFSNGWLRTGDIGRFDEDGCLFVLGRSKELIKRGGHSVYPLEVDSAILSHPDVVEAVCFSLEHPTSGEELVAVFVPCAGSKVDGRDIRHFLEGKLSTYKIPSSILRVAEIPKNATGKTARRSMRAAFSDQFTMKCLSPETELETVLLENWRLVISAPNLGVTDNVFVCGADPIRAQRICDEMKSVAKRVLSPKDIIRNPTVREQALLLAESGAWLSAGTNHVEIVEEMK